jgi:predicted Zn-dependent peptidase
MEADFTDPRVRLVSLLRPQSHLSTFRLCLRKGSLDEASEERGFLHFIEHLVFRCAPRSLKLTPVESVERLGAFVSARTTLDTTEFLLRIHPSQALEGLRELCDLVFARRFESEDLALEKRVVQEEIRLNSQSFAANASRHILLHLFGAGCSEQITGSADDVERIELAPLTSFYNRTYVGGDFVLAHVGRHDFAEVSEVLDRVCRPGCPKARMCCWQTAREPQHIKLPIRGSPVVLMAYRASGYADPGFSALQVLCHALGKKLATSSKELGASIVQLTLRPQYRFSIIEILMHPSATNRFASAKLMSRTVDEILLGAPIVDSELYRALRHVFLETCVERDNQDGTTMQLLRTGLREQLTGLDDVAQELEISLFEWIEKMRAVIFRNPICVSSY